MKGYIHSFESFGALDGPGIRYVVFMQGCPLKCKYCHNRDTWQTNIGPTYEVDEVLNKNNLIDNKLTKNLKAMVGFRNIAVHDYKKIEIKIVQMIIEKHLNDFKELIYYMNKLI